MATSTPRRRYAKSMRTRENLLAAALAEAAERGLRNTSVTRVAARANVAVGSVNYHFDGRDELLRQMMRRLMNDLFGRLAAVHDDSADFFARHRRELFAYLEYVRANPAHVRLTDEIKFLEPDLYRQGVAEWIELLASRLRAGVEEGSVRPMDDAEVVVYAHFLLGARHFLEDLIERDAANDEAVLDAYLNLVRAGLARKMG